MKISKTLTKTIPIVRAEESVKPPIPIFRGRSIRADIPSNSKIVSCDAFCIFEYCKLVIGLEYKKTHPLYELYNQFGK